MITGDRIFLFDMDGTLTPSREPASLDILRPLKELSKYGMIGIISGSDTEYILEQMNPIFDYGIGGVDLDNVILMPCNGTKLYRFERGCVVNVFSLDMKEQIGIDNYNELIRKILNTNSKIINKYKNIPVNSHFIQYRESLLNWSLIGRTAGPKDRDAWLKIDKKENLRLSILLDLKEYVESIGLSIKLGGDTSFDIYPRGWDKSYCLNYLEFKDIYFFGDRCGENGNDYELYISVDYKKRFEVSDYNNTIELIYKTIGGIANV